MEQSPQPHNAHIPAPPKAAIQSHAPPLGTRIQVLWKIEYEAEQDEKPPMDVGVEGSGTVTRWWGATVQDRLTETLGTRNAHNAEQSVYVLLYDAYHEFAEDTAKVAFIAHDMLVDVSQLEDVNKGELVWRVDQTESTTTASASTDDKTQLVSLEQYAAQMSEAVQCAGLSEEADLQILSTMPVHVQAQVASGYRRFADHLKDALVKLAHDKPKDYVVTKADVQKMFANING